MEKRYQIFISSTYVDLAEERKEVIQALLELDCIPVGMELFPATNEDQWTLIKELIDSCDYYLLIVGGRYGSINSEGISYTQMEYEYALEKNIPTISFVPTNPENVPIKKTDKDPEKEQKLNAFLELVRKKMCKAYEGPKDLGSVASRSIIKLIKKHPAIGWIRANNVTTEESDREILKLKRQIESLEDQLNKSKKFAPPGTESLQQGEDEFHLNYSYQEKHWYEENSFDGEIALTWNKIFEIVSPLMVDEGSETSLYNELCKIVEEKIYQEIEIKPEIITLKGTDFQTIKVQLIALGLIEKSERKRSLRDSDAYWRLTPFGENKMMSLKALRKKKED